MMRYEVLESDSLTHLETQAAEALERGYHLGSYFVQTIGNSEFYSQVVYLPVGSSRIVVEHCDDKKGCGVPA